MRHRKSNVASAAYTQKPATLAYSPGEEICVLEEGKEKNRIGKAEDYLSNHPNRAVKESNQHNLCAGNQRSRTEPWRQTPSWPPLSRTPSTRPT